MDDIDLEVINQICALSPVELVIFKKLVIYTDQGLFVSKDNMVIFLDIFTNVLMLNLNTFINYQQARSRLKHKYFNKTWKCVLRGNNIICGFLMFERMKVLDQFFTEGEVVSCYDMGEYGRLVEDCILPGKVKRLTEGEGGYLFVGFCDECWIELSQDKLRRIGTFFLEKFKNSRKNDPLSILRYLHEVLVQAQRYVWPVEADDRLQWEFWVVDREMVVVQNGKLKFYLTSDEDHFGRYQLVCDDQFGYQHTHDNRQISLEQIYDQLIIRRKLFVGLFHLELNKWFKVIKPLKVAVAISGDACDVVEPGSEVVIEQKVELKPAVMIQQKSDRERVRAKAEEKRKRLQTFNEQLPEYVGFSLEVKRFLQIKAEIHGQGEVFDFYQDVFNQFEAVYTTRKAEQWLFLNSSVAIAKFLADQLRCYRAFYRRERRNRKKQVVCTEWVAICEKVLFLGRDNKVIKVLLLDNASHKYLESSNSRKCTEFPFTENRDLEISWHGLLRYVERKKVKSGLVLVDVVDRLKRDLLKSKSIKRRQEVRRYLREKYFGQEQEYWENEQWIFVITRQKVFSSCYFCEDLGAFIRKVDRRKKS